MSDAIRDFDVSIVSFTEYQKYQNFMTNINKLVYISDYYMN